MVRTVRMLRISLLVLVAVAATLIAAPAGAGGGRCHEGFEDRRTQSVRTEGACFLPTVARVDVGTTVSWRADDAIPHTVTGASDAFGAQQPAGELTASRPVSITFDTAGVYPYVCLLHPGMAGAVVVGDAPAVVATSAPGAAGDAAASAAALSVAGVLLLVLVSGPRLRRRRRTTG